jgi:hypothetical protein
MSLSAICRFGGRCLLGLLCFAAPVLAQDRAAYYISFQVPGNSDISSVFINNNFIVTGSYNDVSHVSHGFIRDVYGKITTFDFPHSLATSTTGINDDNLIFGTYVDRTNHLTHGFLRYPSGAFLPFEVSGSGTIPTSINRSGVVTGYYFSVDGGGSFVRYPDGTRTTFIKFSQDHAQSINFSGTITGTTAGTPPLTTTGFVRSAKGTVTLFEAPESAPGRTDPVGIDAHGNIAGNYSDSNDVQQSFIRGSDGHFTRILPPNSVRTQVAAINHLGVITGFYSEPTNGSGGQHMFVRDLKGDITTFDPPGSTKITITGMNDFGVIVGLSGTSGFLRMPDCNASYALAGC